MQFEALKVFCDIARCRSFSQAAQAHDLTQSAASQIVHQLEKQIQDLEKRQAEISVELENPETYANGGRAMELNREFKHNADEIAELTSKWETAASKLAELEAV